MRRFVLAALHTAVALAIASPATGQRPVAPRPADDPFIWLEEAVM